MSALVTNARNRIAYNVVRSLGKRGIAVHCADFAPRAMSSFSRYSAGSVLYPSPYADPSGFVQAIVREGRRVGARVLIPVYEETFLVAKHADVLSRSFDMVVPDYEGILLVHNKDRWAEVAGALDIAVPASYAVAALRGGDVDPMTLRFPVLIKPKQGGGGWGIRELASREELDRFLGQERHVGLPWDRFFIQEKIPGTTLCVAMLMNKGRLRAKAAYRQLREYPVGGGQATVRISVRDAGAEESLERLLAHLDWHGVCQADFVIDARNGRPYLIDLNPRLWGSLAQAIASGVDFPHLVYRMATEGDVEPVEGFRSDVVTRWLGGDLRAFLPHLKAARSKAEFLRNYFFPGMSPALYDDVSLADPLPFVAWLAQSALKAAGLGNRRDRESLEGIWE